MQYYSLFLRFVSHDSRFSSSCVYMYVVSIRITIKQMKFCEHVLQYIMQKLCMNKMLNIFFEISQQLAK